MPVSMRRECDDFALHSRTQASSGAVHALAPQVITEIVLNESPASSADISIQTLNDLTTTAAQTIFSEVALSTAAVQTVPQSTAHAAVQTSEVCQLLAKDLSTITRNFNPKQKFLVGAMEDEFSADTQFALQSLVELCRGHEAELLLRLCAAQKFPSEASSRMLSTLCCL